VRLRWFCPDCGRPGPGPGTCTASEHAFTEGTLPRFEAFAPASSFETAIETLCEISERGASSPAPAIARQGLARIAREAS
jgi:hypothetical protein